MMTAVWWVQLVRVVAVIALVVAAAALATPKGRLPLALRGVMKILKRDSGATAPVPAEAPSVLKRALAFVLVLAAALLALW